MKDERCQLSKSSRRKMIFLTSYTRYVQIYHNYSDNATSSYMQMCLIPSYNLSQNPGCEAFSHVWDEGYEEIKKCRLILVVSIINELIFNCFCVCDIMMVLAVNRL